MATHLALAVVRICQVAVAALTLPIVIGMTGASPGRGQVAAADTSSPAFDVASVRVNNSPGRPRTTIQFSPDTLTMRQVSLWLSLRWAYGADDPQIAGPDFLHGPPLFDIAAKASGSVPENQMRLMLQTLLGERFHLTVHHEKKEMTVMALLVAKGGPRVRESDGKYDPARNGDADAVSGIQRRCSSAKESESERSPSGFIQ